MSWMTGIDAQVDERIASRSSCEVFVAIQNDQASESVRIGPEVDPCTRESTSIMDIEITQHILGMDSPGLGSSPIWDEDDLRKTPPSCDSNDYDPEVELYCERSPSPTPSYVEVFAAIPCTCQDCMDHRESSIPYPPPIREEKLKLYRQWQERQCQKLQERQYREKLALVRDQMHHRDRAILVVSRALDLSERETGVWKGQSYSRWHKRMMKKLGGRYPGFEYQD